MKKLNSAYANAMKEIANRGPFFELLSIEITELDFGYCKAEVVLAEKLDNPFGNPHGGVFASLIDAATFWATYSEIPENKGITTIDLQMDNLGTTKVGKLIAEGKTIKIGRTICLAEASVYDEQGKILAHGKSKMLVLSSMQSIEDGMKSIGYEKELPAKFEQP